MWREEESMERGREREGKREEQMVVKGREVLGAERRTRGVIYALYRKSPSVSLLLPASSQNTLNRVT